jgi:hypothetical protein
MRTSLLLMLALGCGSSPPRAGGTSQAAGTDHAVGTAQAAGTSSASGTPSAAGTARARPAPPKLPPIDVPPAALPPHGTMMLGDMHGTREIPAFVAALVGTVSAREPVVLALEIPQNHEESIQAFLASNGGAEARRQLLDEPFWKAPYQDGRRSVAHVELLEVVRALRAAGRKIDVVAIDDAAGGTPESREAAMANHVIAARRAHPDAALIVYAGNLHTSKHEVGFQPGFAWMAMRVGAAGIPVVSLNARWADGTAWSCSDAVAEHCGVSFLAGRGDERGIRLEPSPDGQYDGWFGVGPVTASPPAGRPELAAGIDAKIAAAASAPSALQQKARRAYEAKRYGECADILAGIPSPEPDTAYNRACCLALAGRKDDAFTWLQYAIKAGFRSLDQIAKDPDLASLRGDPRWPLKKKK